mgnify:CR=1 FL=1
MMNRLALSIFLLFTSRQILADENYFGFELGSASLNESYSPDRIGWAWYPQSISNSPSKTSQRIFYGVALNEQLDLELGVFKTNQFHYVDRAINLGFWDTNLSFESKGIDLTGIYWINPIIFLKLGGHLSETEWKARLSTRINNNVYSSSGNNRKIDLLAGAGAEYPLSEKLSIRAEFNYYRNLNTLNSPDLLGGYVNWENLKSINIGLKAIF